LAAPSDLIVRKNSITGPPILFWTQTPGAVGYNVYRNNNYLNTVSNSGTGRNATYTDNAAPVSGTIHYYVTAFDSLKKKYSPKSNTAIIVAQNSDQDQPPPIQIPDRENNDGIGTTEIPPGGGEIINEVMTDDGLLAITRVPQDDSGSSSTHYFNDGHIVYGLHMDSASGYGWLTKSGGEIMLELDVVTVAGDVVTGTYVGPSGYTYTFSTNLRTGQHHKRRIPPSRPGVDDTSPDPDPGGDSECNDNDCVPGNGPYVDPGTEVDPDCSDNDCDPSGGGGNVTVPDPVPENENQTTNNTTTTTTITEPSCSGGPGCR
jgi:hypothetical protein